MLKSIKTIYLTAAIVCVVAVSNSFAQPGPPGGPPCLSEPSPFGGAACPIDGGVSLLIAAGLAYGGKKTLDLSRKKA